LFDSFWRIEMWCKLSFYIKNLFENARETMNNMNQVVDKLFEKAKLIKNWVFICIDLIYFSIKKLYIQHINYFLKTIFMNLVIIFFLHNFGKFCHIQFRRIKEDYFNFRFRRMRCSLRWIFAYNLKRFQPILICRTKHA
jgi:hypothetical protein